MGLFTKKKTVPAPQTSYDDVVDFLRDMSQPDFTKILKVVDAYRDADKKVKKILNIKLDESIEIEDFTDLLIDDEPVIKPKKITVK